MKTDTVPGEEDHLVYRHVCIAPTDNRSKVRKAGQLKKQFGSSPKMHFEKSNKPKHLLVLKALK